MRCGLHLYNEGHCAKCCVNGSFVVVLERSENVLRLALESYVTLTIVAQVENLVALMANAPRLV